MAQRLVREPKHPHRRTRHRNAPLPGITLRILLVGASRSLLRRGRRIWQRKASCPTVSQCPAGRYRGVLNPPERDRPPRLRQESPLVDHPCTKTHFYSAPQYLVVGIASRNGRKQSPDGARKVSYADSVNGLRRTPLPRTPLNKRQGASLSAVSSLARYSICRVEDLTGGSPRAQTR